MGETQPLARARAAARAFAGERTPGELTPLGGGLIHETFATPLDTAAGAPEIVVQCVNTDVFTDPVALMQNLERITAHLRSTSANARHPLAARAVLEVLRTRDGETTFTDAEGGLWRAFPRIVGGVGLGANRSPAQLAAAGRAFGDYARRLATLPEPPLHVTLPRFHDFAQRRRDFDRALQSDALGRAAQASETLDAIGAACEQLERALPIASVEALPTRVAHHDCKLDNLLFDAASGEALCVLDLDTSMPGRLLSDFGELVRSSTATRTGAVRRELAALDLEAFEGLARGYVAELAEILTSEERDTLPLAGAHMALMNALRFATDHLAGDVYFRIFEPGQNLLRARAQTRHGVAMLDAEQALRQRVTNALTEL